MPHRIPFIQHPNDLPTQQAILNGAPNMDGIYAISTDINAQWVKTAYERGLFPWYSDDQPVLWHSPQPRMVLPLDDFKTSFSLKKRIKQWIRQPQLGMRITINHAFEQVISACANTARADQDGTWITHELAAAYTDLHHQNHAVSVELWQNDVLVAGLYGVLIGKMFFGESMFTTITDGSKVVLACWVAYLRRHQFKIIDCQQNTVHLSNMGGGTISQEAFFTQSMALMKLPSLNFEALSTQANLLDLFTADIMTDQSITLTLQQSSTYPCSYLPEKTAQSVFVMPSDSRDTHQYSQLIQQGFRRSGTLIYRPNCPSCQECISTRIQAALFVPNRSQKRCLKKWQHLTVEVCELQFDPEHYALYLHYQQNRHHDGDMAQESEEQYRQFLLQSQVAAFLIAFRDENGTLLMVSLIDQVSDGLSAVYTFYRISPNHTGLGTYGILWQLNLTQRLSLPYLYLGFWIKDSEKMAYKINFSATQLLRNNTWQPHP